MTAYMNRIIALPALLLMSLFAAVSPATAQGNSADIDAAARGVVRVVIIAADEERGIVPISHGSGFAVSPKRIVTNAHVVRDAVRDGSLRVGIVPSEGGEAVYGRILKVSPRNDLALVEITGDLRLPPLVLSGEPVRDSGDSYAVGYPMNVDRAQGLEIGDIFKAQPPVKSRGFLAGTRPSRQFHTVLHTAPIASGNSGGPLLDGCGRVLGVNSFGADSGGADAEFFFAVSNRELAPFLRENGIEPRANDTQCRSLAALDADERARIEQEQMAARAELQSRSAEERARRERAQFEAEMQVRDERDDRMFASVLLLLLGAGAGWWAYEKRGQKGGGAASWPAANKGAAAVGAGLVLIALFLQLTRPGIDEIDRRVANALGNPDGGDGGETGTDPQVAAGNVTYICTIDKQRSRITSSRTEDVEFSWNNAGCVNDRTQYGFSGGTWSRAFVPNDEQAVSVASFDPQRRLYRTERYLLSRNAMQAAREGRGKYRAPACGAEDAAATLGDQQSAVLSALPARPNERLVYSCEAKTGD